MNPIHFVLGLVALALIAGPPVYVGITLAGRLLPDERGPLLSLAAVVLAVSVLLASAHVLGWFGELRLGWLIAVGVVEVTVTAVSRRRWPSPPSTAKEPPPPAPRWSVVIALATIAAVVAQWSTFVASIYTDGLTDYDSMHYHLPHAARFAQTGSLTMLHFVDAGLTQIAFHPSDSEVVHALGILALGNDALSPLLNLGWLAMLFLAAWCVGRTYGRGPHCVVAAAVIAGMSISAVNGGTALSDTASYACLLAAVAFLVPPDRGRGHTVIAGAAAGLALSIKLTMLTPAVMLTLGVIVLAARGHRRLVARDWLVPLFVIGSFWYLRNTLRAGNPLPTLSVGPIAATAGGDAERYGYTVLHYLGDASVWRHWFLPGLAVGTSPAWPVIAIAVLFAIAWPFRRGGPPVLRMLSIMSVATIGAYLVTPTTAYGPPGLPVLFALNIRYAFPAIIIALVLLPLAPVFRGHRARAALLGGLVVLVIASIVGARRDLPGGLGPIPPYAASHHLAAIAIGLVVFVAGSALLVARARRVPPSRVAAAGAIACVVLLVASYAVQRHYVRHRYAADPAYAWARDISDARIAITGLRLQSPYYGASMSNYVQYVGTRSGRAGFGPAANCPEWRRDLASGRYDYLVVESSAPGEPVTDEPQWAASLPGTRVVVRTNRTTVYALDGPVTDAGCT
jgi:hypothetical protein